jgi:integrase
MAIVYLDRKTVAELWNTPGLHRDTVLKGFTFKVRKGAGGAFQRRFLIQYRIGNKQGKPNVGDAAKINVDQARKKAEKLFAKITLGQDPQAEKRTAQAATAITVKSVVDQYLAMKERQLENDSRRASTVNISRLYLTGAYFKPLHTKPINAVTKADVATRLNAIIETRSANTASRCRAHLSAFFVWAMKEGIADSNPVIGTNDPQGNAPRDRVLSNGVIEGKTPDANCELARIWRACKDDDYGKIIKLLILSGQRRGEIGAMRWSWLTPDLTTLTIPATVAKNHRQHVLPITDMMRSIIKSVPQMVDRDPLFGQRAEGFTGWQHYSLDVDLKPWVLHDIRRSVATGMADLGIPPHTIEAVLNHVSGHKSGVAGIYNRSTYAREMRIALDRWSDHVQSIVTGDARKVVNFPTG